MKRLQYTGLLVLALLINSTLLAQPVDYMQQYKVAKAQLDDGRYDQALAGFAKLLAADPAHTASAYTSYFYGVAAYNLDKKEEARDMFLQVLQKYPDWEKINETYLWLSKLSFELSSPNQGLYYANLVRQAPALEELAGTLKTNYLAVLDTVTLQVILEEHEDDREVARILAEKIVSVPLNMRDNERLRSLIVEYQLDSTALGLTIPPNVFKEKYRVAIMLPLFADRLWQSGVYLRKTLAVDLYEGIQLALEELDSSRIDVVVFDTRKDSLVTHNILASGQLQEVDAIIGPLYPQPLALVSAYAYEHKINFINPVTTNSELLKDNPYAFLIRTGAESMGKIIAGKVAGQFENKAYAVYYGARRSDSITAFSYIRQMAADSFALSIIHRAEPGKARAIYDSLTSSVPVVDSVELRRMWKEKERVRSLPMKDSLLLKVDSLGHIFIASDNKAIAAELMAAMTSRGDTTQLIGIGNWFSVANAGLDLMEELGVWLAMQAYENRLDPVNLLLRERYMAKYHKKPGKYVLYGYHTMKMLAESLFNYGVYFQHGYKENGNLNEWFDYTMGQDNQHLVLYKIEQGVPVIVNFDGSE